MQKFISTSDLPVLLIQDFNVYNVTCGNFIADFTAPIARFNVICAFETGEIMGNKYDTASHTTLVYCAELDRNHRVVT